MRWDRIDLDAGTLKVLATISRVDGHLVINEPKTDGSRRTVPLPPAMVTVLRKRRKEQKVERRKAGDRWVDGGPVFTNEFGGPVEPRNLLRVVEVAAKKAGVDGVGIHTLRHSAAVSWLESRRSGSAPVARMV
ncbi:MAG: tyrosine-type recombinase/integrase [Actinomycetia bacterium]|nr:tyrosine-type recombinase/integrase [Actinomycetes bacterium]